MIGLITPAITPFSHSWCKYLSANVVDNNAIFWTQEVSQSVANARRRIMTNVSCDGTRDTAGARR